jgi:hypothetical protein
MLAVLLGPKPGALSSPLVRRTLPTLLLSLAVALEPLMERFIRRPHTFMR